MLFVSEVLIEPASTDVSDCKRQRGMPAISSTELVSKRAVAVNGSPRCTRVWDLGSEFAAYFGSGLQCWRSLPAMNKAGVCNHRNRERLKKKF